MQPDQLREKLFSAIARGDEGQFTTLCRQHLPLILESFPAWTKVPEAVRADGRATEAWARSLIVTAQYFQRLGHPELLERLTGGADNPVTRWNRVFGEAAQLDASGRYEESARLLLGILSEMGGASGSAVDALRPKIYGLLGSTYFHAGDVAEAHRFTALALADCQRIGDREGVRIYSENLNLLSNVGAAGAVSETSGDEARLRGLIAKAQDVSDEVRYESSNQLLFEVLAEMRHAEPSLTDAYRGKVYGLLGLNLFRLGDFEEARRYTELALEDCRRVGDEEGVRIYSANLAAISEEKSK